MYDIRNYDKVNSSAQRFRLPDQFNLLPGPFLVGELERPRSISQIVPARATDIHILPV